MVKDGLRIAGKIKIDVYRAGFVDAVSPYLDFSRYLQKFMPSVRIERLLRAVNADILQLKDEYHIRTAVECHNLIMDSTNYGIDLIVQQLAGMNTYPLALTYGEIGTGATTPALSDTALTTPTNRAAVGFQQDFGGTDAIVQFFFSDSQLANQTYKEFGTFAGGTTTIGSGQIFNHALLSPNYVKSAGTDTTVEVDISIANS